MCVCIACLSALAWLGTCYQTTRSTSKRILASWGPNAPPRTYLTYNILATWRVWLRWLDPYYVWDVPQLLSRITTTRKKNMSQSRGLPASCLFELIIINMIILFPVSFVYCLCVSDTLKQIKCMHAVGCFRLQLIAIDLTATWAAFTHMTRIHPSIN